MKETEWTTFPWYALVSQYKTSWFRLVSRCPSLFMSYVVQIQSRLIMLITTYIFVSSLSPPEWMNKCIRCSKVQHDPLTFSEYTLNFPTRRGTEDTEWKSLKVTSVICLYYFMFRSLGSFVIRQCEFSTYYWSSEWTELHLWKCQSQSQAFLSKFYLMTQKYLIYWKWQWAQHHS